MATAPAAKSSLGATGSPSPVKKKKKKSGKKKQTEDRGPVLNAIASIPEKWRIPAAGAATAIVLGAVILLAQFGGKKELPDGGANAPGGAEAATPQGFAVVDSMPGGGSGGSGGLRDEEAAPRNAAAVIPLEEDVPPGPLEGWALKPDPPAAAPEPLAAAWGVPQPRNSFPPLFAGMSGPFVAVDDELGPPKGTEQGIGRATLYDLRSGKSAGFFRTGQRTIPFWGKSRLSPDGKWVVTEAVDGDVRRTGKDGILYVYRQGEQTKPTAELKLPGPVAWLDFVAADRIAIYTFDPKPVLCVYTVADGKKLQTIPLTSEMHPPPEANANVKGTPSEPKFLYDPHDTAGAVSPGGKYVAIGGKMEIAVLSLAEGKQVAAISIGETTRWLDHHGISFHPDGTQLFAFTTVRLPNSAPRRLRGWSLITGRREFDVPPLGVSPLGGRPLPGPDPGTMILTENPAVIDTTAGVVHYHLGFTPVRWAGKDTLLGFGPYAGAPHLPPPKSFPLPDKNQLRDPKEFDAAYKRALFNDNFKAVYVTRFNRAEYEKNGGETLRAVAARPPVLRGDRTGLNPMKPEPPANWTAPPSTTPPALPSADAMLPAWPAALSANHAATISFTYQPIPRPQYPVDWHRHDLATGKSLGPPVRLWPWAQMHERHVTMIEKFPTPPAAVTDDGNRLAMRDPSDPYRIDVWDADGKRLGGFVPYDYKTPVEWIGWSGDRLLTLGGGRLTGWSGPDGKAVFEVEGGYTLPVATPPGRAWVAALAGDAVDILDGATGKCLARCVAPPGDVYLALEVAPDGKAVAAARKGATKIDRPSPKPVDKRPAPLLAPAEYVADVWDLTSGKRESIPFGAGKFGFIHWTGPEHILTAADGLELIDRRAGAVVELFYYPARGGPADGTQILAGTPDGRVWASIPAPDLKPGESERRVWRTQTLPDANDVLDFTVLAADREYLRPTLGPIRVEVDLGTEDRSRRAAERIATSLAKRGFTVGPRGWVLRISHEVVEGKMTLYTSTYEDGRKTPDVKFTWRLYAPDGGMVWEGTTTGSFRGGGSRYHAKTKRGGSGLAPNTPLDPVTPFERVEYYDFGGKDMRDAIASEILDVASDNPTEPPGGLPTALIRAGGASKPLPLARTITISIGP